MKISKARRRISVPKSLLIFMLLVVLIAGYAVYESLTGPVDDKRFENTIAGIKEMVEMTETGNLREGEKSFNRVHGFFHDLDPALRKKDPTLARELWDTVLLIETQYGIYRPDLNKLKNYGELTIDLLRKAKNKMSI